MTNRVEIYDTTLRDGSQGLGISFSVLDKLRIAERLDAFGVHYIEGGWPGSNPKDVEFFDEAKRRTFRHARLAAFGATRRKGVTAEDDDQVRLLIDAETPGGDDRRQDVAAARARSAADDARGKPGDDRRHDCVPEVAGPVRGLRRGALVRRLQGRRRVRAGDAGGRRTGRRGRRRAVRHQRRVASVRDRRASRTGCARAHRDADRHPHARRHRARRRERARGARRRRDARAGHHQRHRRADGQLQPDVA